MKGVQLEKSNWHYLISIELKDTQNWKPDGEIQTLKPPRQYRKDPLLSNVVIAVGPLF